MAEERSRFGIGAALAVSVVVHLLILLVGWLVPLKAQAVPAPVEETVLQFDLTPTEPAEESVQPLGDVPIPAPRPQPALPQPQPVQPEPELDEFVQDPAPTDLPPPPTETPEPAREETPESPQPTEAVEQQAVAGVDLPGDGIEREGQPDSARPSEATAPPGRPFNVESALRDFGKAMRQPRPDSDGSRTGMNIPDLPPLPATGFGFGNLEFESRDFDWSDYARQIYMAIWRAWHNRLYATSDEFERWSYESGNWMLQHATRVVFTIQNNGQVTGIAIESPSGCYPLDDSAVDALTEVILPPLPADFPRQQETVHARFIADGSVKEMRRFLAFLKQQGFF